MGQAKDAGKDGGRTKDLQSKKLSVEQQEVVKGGITDGTSNTLMLSEKALLPALQAARLRRDNGSVQP
jgi:hypothetical protein